MLTYDTNSTKMLLEQSSCNYEMLDSGVAGEISEKTAAALGLDPQCVFKTLLFRGKSRKFYVFLLPCDVTPDMEKLKKAAREEELFPLPSNKHKWHTGFAPECLCPIGMKAAHPTFIDKNARYLHPLAFCAGEEGKVFTISFDHFLRVKYLRYADLI